MATFTFSPIMAPSCADTFRASVSSGCNLLCTHEGPEIDHAGEPPNRFQPTGCACTGEDARSLSSTSPYRAKKRKRKYDTHSGCSSMTEEDGSSSVHRSRKMDCQCLHLLSTAHASPCLQTTAEGGVAGVLVHGQSNLTTDEASPAVDTADLGSTEGPRGALELWHEKQMRLLLTQASTQCTQALQTAGHCFLGPSKRRRMSLLQACNARNVAQAVLVHLNVGFRTSIRTFVLAGAIFDRWMDTTTEICSQEACAAQASEPDIGSPLACFLLACKSVETFAPRVMDVVDMYNKLNMIWGGCSVGMLCEAERSVLTTLGWDINLVTGIDILHKLLSFADPQPLCLQACAELQIAEASCSILMSKSMAPWDMAVGALLNACNLQSSGEAFPDFVPVFMRTAAASTAGSHLKAFSQCLHLTALLGDEGSAWR